MNMKSIVCTVVAGAVLFVGSACSDAQTTAFYFTSSPESWIADGETVLATPGDGFSFEAYKNYDNGVSFSIIGANYSRWWYLDFAAPGEVELTPGIFLGATRWPFQDYGSPGLSFSGNGNGNNELTGHFTVLEVSYGGGGVIQSFAADFTQYDGGLPNEWNVGSIRYNSLIPIPEPGTLSLLGSAAFAYLLRLRRLRTEKSPPNHCVQATPDGAPLFIVPQVSGAAALCVSPLHTP